MTALLLFGNSSDASNDGKRQVATDREVGCPEKVQESLLQPRWRWQAPRQGFFGEEEEEDEGRPQRLSALLEDGPLGKGVPKSQVGEES